MLTSGRAMLPHPRYLRRIFVRSAMIWMGVRAIYVVALLLSTTSFRFIPAGDMVSPAIHPSIGTRLILIALTGVLVWHSRRRYREELLPANLGTSPVSFWAVPFVAALGLDLMTQTLLRGL